jgi:hypothetical protein
MDIHRRRVIRLRGPAVPLPPFSTSPHTLLLYLCFLLLLHILPILTSPPPHSPLIIILRFLLLLRILPFILLFLPRLLLLLLFRQRFLLRRRTNTRTS